MFAAEVAIDELAAAVGMDPIELRVRNEPDVDPEDGKPWSGRHLVECLRRGADAIRLGAARSGATERPVEGSGGWAPGWPRRCTRR